MSDNDYIDKLYKDAFKTFEIEPKRPIDVGKETYKTKPISALATNKIFWVAITSVVIIGSAVAIIMLKSTTPLEQHKTPLPPLPVNDTVPSVNTEKEQIIPVSGTDSFAKIITPLQKKQKIISTINNKALPATPRQLPKADSALAQPVIIHKTIIKHDTIFEHVPALKK